MDEYDLLRLMGKILDFFKLCDNSSSWMDVMEVVGLNAGADDDVNTGTFSNNHSRSSRREVFARVAVLGKLASCSKVGEDEKEWEKLGADDECKVA